MAQVATALILVLAANTSFADFPRLSSFLARDGFLRASSRSAASGWRSRPGSSPSRGGDRAAHRLPGERLGLIPLYTLGVFIAFTLSQGGMLVRWWTAPRDGWRAGLAINGLGTLTTAVVAVVVGTSNFFQGAWLVIVLVPILMLILMASTATTARWTRPWRSTTSPKPRRSHQSRS